MIANTAQASVSNANFFETTADRAVNSINSFAVKIKETAESLGDDLRGGVSAAAEGLQNGVYAIADQPWFSRTYNAVDSDKITQPGFGMAKADLSSFFGQVKCFFGFGCEIAKTAESPKVESKTQTQSSGSQSAISPVKPITEAETLNTDAVPIAESEAVVQIGGTDGAQVKDVPPVPQTENKTVTIIQPTKEIQTIHTVTNNTNTVVVDEDIKAKVNLLLRQLDSDRPSFSLGQGFTIPSNLSGKTLNIGSSSFIVDDDGNVNAQTITTAGNVIVQGNFTVSGAQTFSGATALNAATAGPLFAIDQTGAGASLRADNLMFKESTISTEDTDSAILLDPNGTGAVQFHTTGNYIDSNGNLVLAGGITAASLNAGAGAIQTTGAVSGGTFNGLTVTPGTGSLTIANGKVLTANNSIGLSGTDGKTLNIGGNNLTFGTSGDTSLTLPLAGTLATLAGNEALTNKTINGLTLTSLATGFSVAGGTASKTLTVNDNASISGSNTGDQTITLTGDVTGTGTGSFGATIANNAVTYGKMQNVSATNRLLGRATAGSGLIEEITVGGDLTQNGSNFTINNGAVSLGKMANLAANSIIGNNTGSAATPTALSATDVRNMLSLNNVENTALTTWPGSMNITTLGTIGTGTWNATAIADDKIVSSLTGKTYNGLTLAGQATGFTIAGGTTSKTLTLNNSLGFSGGDGKTLNIGANNITLTSGGDVALTLPTAGTVTALGNTTTGSGSVVLQTSPSLTTPSLGVASATSINKLAITAPATSATLTIADGKTFTASNTLTLTGNDGASLAIGGGGTLGTGAYATIANYATLANPSFTGTVTIPSPFTLGATSVTATGTQLNYLVGASGTTGTTNLVFSNSPTLVTPVLGAASATSLSAPTLTTTSGDLTLDPTGNVAIKGSTADNTMAALNVTNSTPLSLLFARNDGNIGINNILPGRKLDITETTSATPQLRLTSDSSNYAEMYVDSVGGLFLDTTGSSATNISILDQNLKVCTGGSFGSNTCPTSGFNITGTGNLVVAGQVAATDYQKICPTGYVWVPGSAKYGTMPGFCAMKYEAKNVGGVATSQMASTPWTSVTQVAARAACRALGAGYHLISEAEWMTIADNAANTGSNWFGGTVGTNFMYSGHNDNGPATKLAASTDDDGYSGTGDSASACDDVYNNFVVGDDTITGRACAGQKRTFTLSNGNVIWDISGNVWEWTDAYIYDSDGTKEMPLPATGWLEYTAVTNYKGLNYLRPADTSWSATQSIGRIYTDSNCAYGSDGAGGYNETCGVYDHYYHAFIRGGTWDDGASAGAFSLLLNDSPSGVGSTVGFRCAR